MPVGKFQFGPQPALDKAQADRQKCEQGLAEAQKRLQAEKQKLAAIDAEIRTTQQQIVREGEKLYEESSRGACGLGLAARDAYVNALRGRLKQQQGRRDEQQKQVRWAQQRVAIRKQELAEFMSRISSLEKFKERKLGEHKKAVAREEAGKLEDVTSLYHQRRRQ